MTTERIIQLPFFFVLGRPRSGTTLLRTMLDAHPSIVIPLENSSMIHLYFRYRKVRYWDAAKLDRLAADFFRLDNVKNWKLDREGIREKLEDLSGTQLSFHQVIRIFYFHYRSEFRKGEIRILGDKSPLFSLYPKQIFRAFPDARFIHLVRDYRSHLLSMRHQDLFSPSETFILMQWKQSAEQIGRLKADRPGSFLTLRYEDLVSDPEPVYREVCEFLGVKFLPGLLDPETRRNAVRNLYSPEFLDQWQPGLTGKITTAHTEKWKTGLPSRSVMKADYIAGRTGARFHYLPVNEDFPFLFRIAMQIRIVLFRLQEMNRYLYDRLPLNLKTRIRNRKFILSYRLIKHYKRRFGSG
jgi:hypothetical protein